jgi:hypothetical protein
MFIKLKLVIEIWRWKAPYQRKAKKSLDSFDTIDVEPSLLPAQGIFAVSEGKPMIDYGTQGSWEAIWFQR